MIYLNKCCRPKSKRKKCNGRDVIISAILFENGVAQILSAEGELIDKLIERKESPLKLVKLNNQIGTIVCCLRDFEEKIVMEISKE